MERHPGYYSIIPAEVRYDSELTANAKLLYGEITALANSSGVCWASNAYFSKLYQVSKGTISRWIHSLEDAGYITVEVVRREGGEVESRNIYIAPPLKNEYTPPIKNDGTPPLKNDKGNNTSSSNITSFNRYSPSYERIVNHLNDRTGQHYRPSSRKTQSLIHARLEEGYTEDDLMAVIDSRAADWMDDDRMRRYLRPETLFGTKFEGYLNAAGQTRKMAMDGEGWL